MHRPTGPDNVVYFSIEEFKALAELISERLREPRQSTSAGHNVQTASEAAAQDGGYQFAPTMDQHEQLIQRLAFLEDRISALSTTVARNKKEWNETRSVFKDRFDDIAQHMNDGEEFGQRLDTLNEALTTQLQKTTKKTEEFHVQIENLGYRINDLEDTPQHSVEEFAARIHVLENRMADMRIGLRNAFKV